MSESSIIADRISSLCGGLWLPQYISGKLLTDPLYEGVYQEVIDSGFPLLDVGCGVGILAMYLRERGWQNPVIGFDFDQAKIEEGKHMLALGGYSGISLSQGDATLGLPEHKGDVAILDILQFFDNTKKSALLKSAASRVPPGGKIIVRSCLIERRLRFYITLIGDMFSKLTFWMKTAPVQYPTEDFFRKVLEAEGLSVEIRPCWGNTPFNNYIILASRPE